MKALLERRNKFKYYRFYHNYDHDTKDCHDLNEQNEKTHSSNTPWEIRPKAPGTFALTLGASREMRR